MRATGLDGLGAWWMVRYRRDPVAGGTFFFTVALADRRAAYLTTYISDLRAAVRRVRAERPFAIDAMVVLPEHLHALFTLPAGDGDFAGRWRGIKARFSRSLKARGMVFEPRDIGGVRLWQRRFWEHTIRDAADFARHADYIHYNPVKHGLVCSPAAWPYSSLHAWVRAGVLPLGWGGSDPLPVGLGAGQAGERDVEEG